MDLLTLTVYLPTLALVVARAAGMVLLAPVFSHPAVPVRLRVLIALVFAIGITARIGSPVVLAGGLGSFGVAVLSELLIGLLIGYAARLVFIGVQLGAFHIGQQMGLGLAELYDPFNDSAGGSISQLLVLLTVVIFLSIGGHRELIGAITESFDRLPPAGFAGQSAMLAAVVTLLGSAMLLALKVAAPVLVTMLLVTAAMGFLQKTVPQCHLLSVGLPIQALLGLVVLAATVAIISPLVTNSVQFTFEKVLTVVK